MRQAMPLQYLSDATKMRGKVHFYANGKRHFHANRALPARSRQQSVISH